MNCTPGLDNSSLINTENAVPIKPDNNANIRYKVPISLALEDQNHLSNHNDTLACFNNKLLYKFKVFSFFSLFIDTKCLPVSSIFSFPLL